MLWIYTVIISYGIQFLEPSIDWLTTLLYIPSYFIFIWGIIQILWAVNLGYEKFPDDRSPIESVEQEP